MNNFMMACLLGIIAFGCPVDSVFAQRTSFIVSSAPGNVTDIVARKVAKQYPTENTVANMTGAAGTLAVAEVVKNPDAVLIGSSTSISAAPATMKNISYDPIKDIQLVTSIASVPQYVVTRKKYKNKDEFLAIAQKGGLTFGAPGFGSLSHLHGVQFMRDNKIDAVVVPFKGVNEVVTELIADRIDFAIVPLTMILEHPELTILPDKFSFWIGAFVSSKVPAEKRQEIARKIRAIMDTSEFKEDVDKLNISILNKDIDFAKEINDYKKLVDSVQFGR